MEKVGQTRCAWNAMGLALLCMYVNVTEEHEKGSECFNEETHNEVAQLTAGSGNDPVPGSAECLCGR